MSNKAKLSKKNKTFIILAASVVLIAAVTVFIIFFMEKKPLKSFSAQEVSAILVQSAPPYQEAALTDAADIEKISAAISQMTIYRKVKPKAESEKRITYQIELKDGTKREMNLYYPYFDIDGVTYLAEFDSSTLLSTDSRGYLHNYSAE